MTTAPRPPPGPVTPADVRALAVLHATARDELERGEPEGGIALALLEAMPEETVEALERALPVLEREAAKGG